MPGFRETALKAGKHGVMTRGCGGDWKDKVIHLCEVEQLPTSFKMTALEIASDRFGNYDPKDADLKAIDWYVVAKATRLEYP